MERKVFLEKNRSKFSVNAQSEMGVDLETKVKLMQGSNVLGDFSLFEQYNAERDACNKYRMIFVVNPICSNVLFNMVTEVVQDEGSDHVRSLSNYGVSKDVILDGDNGIINESQITRTQAIRDTEYSHPKNGGFEYHCGTDIFNNHMLRNDSFVHINKIHTNAKNDCKYVYNTINDYLRDGEGKIVESYIDKSSISASLPKTKLHLYHADSLLSFRRAYLNRIKEKDGWIGFVNPGNIEIPNSDNSGVTINRMLANKKACEFIDMYPDRTLFSFVPKYNEFRRREEKNWDYCLTYPFEKDYEKVNEVCGGMLGAIKATFEERFNSSSIKILSCRSLFRHTLKVGSHIMIYYWVEGEENGEKTFEKYAIPVKVISVSDRDGKEDGHSFTIRLNDVSMIYDSLIYPEEAEGQEEDEEEEEEKVTAGEFYFKKISSGNECEYYFRKYKKYLINGKEPNSDLTKLAYAENIYGDREAQVVFTDSIDIEGLYDHMGRPLSEMYFTVVKRNAGYEKWYGGSEALKNDEDVEFSHCFGEVTSGLDFGDSSALTIDYNIRYLHNVKFGDDGKLINWTDKVATDTFGEVFASGANPQVLESGITIGFDEFYGDVVEFDPFNFTETEISPVLHRVNTAQRETTNTLFYNKLQYDSLERDDYSALNRDEGPADRGFRTAVKNAAETPNGETPISVPGNIRPEGYFYNPHTKIKLREDGDLHRVRAKFINYGSVVASASNITRSTFVDITVPTNYNFHSRDFIAFYTEGGVIDGEEHEKSVEWGEIKAVSGNVLTLEFKGNPFGATTEEIESAIYGENRRYRAYYTTEGVPLYAAFNASTQEFVWRGFISPSQMSSENEMFNTTFSNGHFYIEKNITFFMRRQDPMGVFGLSYARLEDGQRRNPLEYYNIDSTYLDLSQVFNFYNKLDNICY